MSVSLQSLEEWVSSSTCRQFFTLLYSHGLNLCCLYDVCVNYYYAIHFTFVRKCQMVISLVSRETIHLFLCSGKNKEIFSEKSLPEWLASVVIFLVGWCERIFVPWNNNNTRVWAIDPTQNIDEFLTLTSYQELWLGFFLMFTRRGSNWAAFKFDCCGGLTRDECE